ncbi:MAG TPA: phosphate acyltransferase [Candidatus Aminicenantes bacterium]|nr:phosphate acyltransferase [Candidatus Aminicenantes bacterium]
MIRTFSELAAAAEARQGITIGVPAPTDDSSVLTVLEAAGRGLARFILCGDPVAIEAKLLEHGGDPGRFEIIPTTSEEAAAQRIVALARENRVNVILKGFLPTAKLMKPVLDKETGLRTGSLLSDILLLENPRSEEPELLGLTDGGLNILPDLAQKRQIVDNSVRVFHKLGYESPRVGIMAAVEAVKESMPATLDAAALTEMNRKGEISGCRVYGPLALDIAVSPEAARHKGIESEVAGRVQIMVTPSIEAGNLLGKAFTYYLKLPVAHVVMGATHPILIPSRNESEHDKFYSVALGVMIA